VHHVLTSVDESKQIHHNCIPPADYKPTDVEQESLQLVKQRYPDLLPLVESGILVAVQPAKMLAGKAQKLQQSSQQRVTSAAATDSEQQTLQQQGEAQQLLQDCFPGSPCSADFVAQVAEDPALHGILCRVLPELLFIVGTVHVSKQSAEQVKQVLKVSKGLQDLLAIRIKSDLAAQSLRCLQG
jgi:hypothetical protein